MRFLKTLLLVLALQGAAYGVWVLVDDVRAGCAEKRRRLESYGTITVESSTETGGVWGTTEAGRQIKLGRVHFPKYYVPRKGEKIRVTYRWPNVVGEVLNGPIVE